MKTQKLSLRVASEALRPIVTSESKQSIANLLLLVRCTRPSTKTSKSLLVTGVFTMSKTWLKMRCQSTVCEANRTLKTLSAESKCHSLMHNCRIKCSRCSKLQHTVCINWTNTFSVYGGEQNYVCFQCQLLNMDMFTLPMLTLCKPFVINKSKSRFGIKDGRNISEYRVEREVIQFFSSLPKEERARWGCNYDIDTTLCIGMLLN